MTVGPMDSWGSGRAGRGASALSGRIAALLAVAIACGAALRLVYPEDIVYAGDESWTFQHVQDVRDGGPWPLVGMPSSRGVNNAGMSVWVFVALGALGQVTTPAGLARAVAMLAMAAHVLALVIPFRLVKDEREREPWIWAVVLAMTNPILVYLERKIWAQSVLPIFIVLLFCAWFRRKTRAGAFTWGALGALIGQIHMAGFFFTPALAVWTFLFGGRMKHTRWGYWAVGSALGAAPAVPWILYLLRERPHASGSPWWHRFRLEFYQYFLSDPSGLCGEYFLGKDVLRTMAHPFVAGHPTYLVLVAHVALALASFALALRALRFLWERRAAVRTLVGGGGTETGLLLSAILVGMGALMTLPGIAIHRHYMLATFPLQYVFTALVALQRPAGRRWLLVLFFGGLVVSAGQLSFIHATGAFRTPTPTSAVAPHP